jgi:cell division protein FtsQ
MAMEKRIPWDWDYYDPKDSLLMRVADNRGVRRRKRIKTFKQLISYFIFLVLFLMLMAVAGWRLYAYLITSPRFNIEFIQVNATNFLNREALNASLTEIKGRNIFLLDLNQIQKKLKANPWVDYCFIKRVLPNKLSVEITEEKPAALLKYNGELYLISSNGVLLQKYDSRKFSDILLPLITDRSRCSIKALKLKLPLLMEAIKEIKTSYPQLLKQIAEFDLSEEDNVRLRLHEFTCLVNLGNKNFSQHLKNFLLIFPEIEEKMAQLDYIDLRFDHQIILHQALESR